MNKTSGKFALPSAAYDVLKDTALIYLPALGAFYVALSTVWHWGYIAEVTGTVVALGTLLGAFLKISTVSYNNSDKSVDGTLVVDQSDPLKDSYVFDVSKPLDEVADSNTITLRIDNQTPKAILDAYQGKHEAEPDSQV
jgi:hypothetical protein